MKLNIGIILVLVFGVIALVAGLILLVLTGHDAGQYVANVGVLLTAVAGFIALIRSQQKQGETIDTIKTNTNGTLSALNQRVASAEAKLNVALSKLSPDHAQEVLETTISKDQLPAVSVGSPSD